MTVLGFRLGPFAFVKADIEAMLILVVVLSVLPMVVELLRARRHGSRTPGEAQPERVAVPGRRARAPLGWHDTL